MHLLSIKTLTIALLLANFLFAKKYLVEVGGDDSCSATKLKLTSNNRVHFSPPVTLSQSGHVLQCGECRQCQVKNKKVVM